MRMRFTPKISGNTEFDITLTLTLEEMMKLKSQLDANGNWPAWKLGALFGVGVDEIKKHIETEQEIEE